MNYSILLSEEDEVNENISPLSLTWTDYMIIRSGAFGGNDTEIEIMWVVDSLDYVLYIHYFLFLCVKWGADRIFEAE